ncbi:hypothetical protein DXG01_010245 [Tephrocybe rancida]|nr:hypothetical protein DXG01_010245 [Tephrocybe rancida]
MASSDGHGGKDGQDHGKDGQHGHGVVKGKVFDRLITIWLENTNFDAAVADPNLQALAKQGLSLTNYFALTHPSEPNYVASVGGEYFGINSDALLNLPTNVSSIVDLLEDKGISWAEYQEDMPSTGFTGFQFQNPKTQATDYVRKHNIRLRLELGFDENGSSKIPNRVFTILLGNALPKQLVGKVDNNFYTHYSTIATAEANWGLHTLGRWDVGANVFDFVADKTGDKLNHVNIDPILLNLSYPGIFNNAVLAKQPIPNTRLVVNGRTVLPAIQEQWASQVHCTGYFGQVVPPSALTPPPIPPGC